MKLEIKITKEILKRAKMCGKESPFKIPTNCAIALAIREIFPNASVNRRKLFYNKQDEETYKDCKNEDFLHSKLNDEIWSFVIQFDNKSPEERVLMKPFSFEIEVPEEVINQIGIQEAIDIINKSETLNLVEV